MEYNKSNKISDIVILQCSKNGKIDNINGINNIHNMINRNININILGNNQELLSGNQELLSGNQESLSGNQELLSGNQELLSGNQELLSGNQNININSVPVDEKYNIPVKKKKLKNEITNIIDLDLKTENDIVDSYKELIKESTDGCRINLDRVDDDYVIDQILAMINHKIDRSAK